MQAGTGRLLYVQTSALSQHQFSSVQDGIYALRKAHMRSAPSLGSFLNVAASVSRPKNMSYLFESLSLTLAVTLFNLQAA